MLDVAERTSYPQGAPSWADVSSPDIRASAAFYGGLFGWEHRLSDRPEETGGYGMFALRGKVVAGIGPLQEPGAPATWTTYIAVDDADEAATRAMEHGGAIALGPIDVLDAGRMAFLVDPVGGFVGVWQAGGHAGAALVDEPGAVGWSELACRDPEATKGFYAGVFGWRARPSAIDRGDYETFDTESGPVAGLVTTDERCPDATTPHWMTYIVVADAGATAERAPQLGGVVSVDPFDVPGAGRVAVLTDPFGAYFSLLQPDAHSARYRRDPKKSVSSAAHSSASRPPATTGRWLSRG
jgi:predicted enzyme related to lactoylglutathione lyase